MAWSAPAPNGAPLLSYTVYVCDADSGTCTFAAIDADASLMALNFVPDYTYSGVPAAVGVVGPLSTNGTTHTFDYSLRGVDPARDSGQAARATRAECTFIRVPCVPAMHLGTTTRA